MKNGAGDNPKIQRVYCPMENQELTDDQITEALILIFKRAHKGGAETYDWLERLLEGDGILKMDGHGRD